MVNYGPELGPGRITGEEISRLINRPFMGGLDRKGFIISGGEEDIRKAVDNLRPFHRFLR